MALIGFEGRIRLEVDKIHFAEFLKFDTTNTVIHKGCEKIIILYNFKVFCTPSLFRKNSICLGAK